MVRFGKMKGVWSFDLVVQQSPFYPEKFEVEFLEIYFKERADSDMDYGFLVKYLEGGF